VLGRIFKLVFILGLLGGAALVGYAYLADLDPPQAIVTLPVTLDAD
jgi:hypothetical protein